MSRQNIATWLGSQFARLRLCGSWLWRLEARLKGVEMPGRVQFLGRPIISVAPGSRLVLGDGVVLASARRANPLGLAHPTVLRAMTRGAELVLGPRVGVSGASLCAGVSIQVGEGTIFGAGALVLDNDFHHASGDWGWETDCGRNARPIRIGRGVFVGARAIILKGATIGDRAVIGAGAVVVTDVPPGAVAVGNPATIRMRVEG